MIVVDSCHRFTVIKMNGTRVPIGQMHFIDIYNSISVTRVYCGRTGFIVVIAYVFVMSKYNPDLFICILQKIDFVIPRHRGSYAIFASWYLISIIFSFRYSDMSGSVPMFELNCLSLCKPFVRRVSTVSLWGRRTFL